MSGAPKPTQPPVNGPKSFAERFSVSRETAAKLETYAALLRQWQKTINLVAPSTLEHVWSRHFADAAQLVALAPPSAKRWVDLGSGAGFPGLVIALMVNADPASKVTLVESDVRKAAFLREVARQTGVVVDIVPARIESPATQSRVGIQDIVTARALAPLRELLSYPRAFAGEHTVFLFLKGRDAEREVEEARADWAFDAELVPSLTDPEARVVVIRALQPHSR
jgi:16S rRNA (guanine527-N7)-methyltransferase